MSQIQLYDTLSREMRALTSEDGERFRMYCCGPTVYGPAHIGNFRAFLTQDVLYRVLEIAGLNPYLVRNLTDVDDKTIRGATEKQVSLTEFTEHWTEIFHADCDLLNMLSPDVEPKATKHIAEQIKIIESLMERGLAYKTEDGSVYFRVDEFKDYGKLSGLDRSSLKTQEQTSGGQLNQADEYDRDDVADFALWKAYKPEDRDNFWESPWGEGRPGWHIECSAMSMTYLGETFDLHGGGVDLCFPHHENEIAQSEGVTGQPLARHWFHNAHLMVEGRKMSKSLGNLYTLEDLVQKGYHPRVIRYLLVSGHYKQPFNFTLDGLNASKSAIDKIERFVTELLSKLGKTTNDYSEFMPPPTGEDWGHFGEAWECLCNDLNVPAAMGAMFTQMKVVDGLALSSDEIHRELYGIAQVLYALGIELFVSEPQQVVPQEVKALAAARWEARLGRDFAKADELRDEIESKGWVVLDSKDSYELESK